MEALILAAVLMLPFFAMRYQITNPFGYLAFFIGLFFITKFVHHQLVGALFLEDMDATDISAAFIPMALYLGIAYSLSLSVHQFINSSKFKRTPQIQNLVVDNHFQPTRLSSILLLMLPLLLVGIGLLQDVNPIENPLGFRQAIQSKGMFYVLSLQLFLLAVHAAYVPYCLIARKSRPSLLALVAYIISIIFAVISGFASTLPTLVIAPLFFFSICFKKRIEPYIVIGIPVGLLYGLTYSAYRDARLGFSDISLADAFEKVVANPELLTFAFNRFDYLEMYTKGRHFISGIDPDFGVSIVNFFVQAIPRGLWGDKPDNFSTLMTKHLLPQNFDIGVTANFNSLNEFCYSFGSIGIVIGGLVFGVILLTGYRLFLASAYRPYKAMFYLTVVLPYLTAGFMAGFLNDQALPLLILNYLFFRMFVKKTTFVRKPYGKLRLRMGWYSRVSFPRSSTKAEIL